MTDVSIAGAARPPVVCLTGATATGKTDLALALVDALAGSVGVDLISVDSALVYRGMDVGTAKPSADVLARYPHALIDIRDPEHTYDAACFAADATTAIAAAHRAGRLPLLVGGTNLYFRALLQGLSNLPSADAVTRADIEQRAQALGWPALHAELAQHDPETAARLHPNDAQRIGRALEVVAVTGQGPSVHHARSRSAAPAARWQVLQAATTVPDRAALHARIGQRFHAMMAAGLADEVAGLRQRPGLSADAPAMRAVGYRQIWQWLDGVLDRDQAVEAAIAATRQLARRQLTWLRRQANVMPLPATTGGLEKLCAATWRHLDADSRSNDPN